ncbi:proteasome assembly chaperone family protein [Haladaptatus sp. GCM10025707]|uniref:proteasome assembly chaperone family protein n=1 Tax=unclassified Haladaptatus TaxID=2622732 RepID=UPI0023E8FB79|nr:MULTISPECIES: PAC2 family protein [unclassified Haladaptatus]
MAHVQIHDESLEFDAPTLVEGLPGVGLVGKIAADHLVETFEMSHFGSLHCEGIPRVAVYGEGNSTVRAPVRLYADEDRDLVVLQSDVPVSPSQAADFSSCLTGWIADHGATPIFLSGLPTEKGDGEPALYGVSTGDGASLLDRADIASPTEGGVITGPTGSLINRAIELDLTGVGLVVESDKQFPDPEAARILLMHGIGPIADIDVNTDDLVDRAEEIREAKEQLAQRMQDADEESTQAKPLRMFQ